VSVSDMAMAAGLGEWGSAGVRVLPAKRPRTPSRLLPSTRKEPGLMLPWPHPVPQSRRAQIRATRKGGEL
jgi:hypothetical protein